MIREKTFLGKVDTSHPLMQYFDVDEKLVNEILSLGPIYRGAMREVSTKLENIDYEFQTLYDHNPIHHMDCRIKSPSSIAEKLRTRGFEMTLENAKREILDIAGIRVVCNYIDDVFKIAELLTAQEDVELVYVHNYINKPKESGYRSFHLVARVPVFLSHTVENVPVEVQIRTIAMDMWASLEHEIRYKSDNRVSPEAAERLRACAETLAETDREMQDICRQCIRD